MADEITDKEWTNGKVVLYFEVGPSTTITVRRCENGLIRCKSSHCLVTHERITESDLEAQFAYMRRVGAA